MTKTLLEMATEIVTAQASTTQMSSEEISDSLKKLYSILSEIKCKEEGVAASTEDAGKVEIEAGCSIQRNKIICVECGKEFKQLSKSHLRSHNMTPKEYKKKHGIRLGQALVAKSLTAKRRKLAKDKELGKKLAEYRTKKSAAKAAAKSTVKSVAKSTAKSE